MKTTTRKSGTISVTIGTTDGGERTISTGTKDPALAARIIKSANIRAIEVAAKAGALSHDLIQKLVVGKKISVSEAITEWQEWMTSTSGSDRTAYCQASYVNKWAKAAHVLSMAPSQIKEMHIAKWINNEDGNKMSTKRAMMAAVRSFFNYCSIKQYCFGDPTKLVSIKAHLLSHEQKEPTKKTVFSDEEFTRLVEYLEGHLIELMGRPKTTANVHKVDVARFWYCAAIIGRYAGLRLGDICSLEWACFSKPGKMIVWTDKKNTRVELPVDDRLAKGIAAIPTNSRKLCFPEQDAAIRDQPRRGKLSLQFTRILEAAKITGHSFHDLRHTRASELNARGDSIEAIAEALGHGSKESTKTYIHEPVTP